MDLGTVTDVVRDPAPADWRPGDAWLGGGTALFAAPQPHLRRLLDLTTLGWPAVVASTEMLEIAATCTIAELEAWGAPDGWLAAPLIGQCCRAFLGSFKIWNVATVGGNLCQGLPSAPMVALAVALEGECALWSPHGSERRIAAADLVTGSGTTVLEPGELMRAIRLPARAMASRTAFSQVSPTPLGRSAVLVIGRRDPDGLVITITAAVPRPVRVVFSGFPSGPELREALLDTIATPDYLDDSDGDARWRRHLTARTAEEIRLELLAFEASA